MDKILVPVDGSQASKEAVSFAARLASKTGAELVALRILDVEHYTGQWGAIKETVKGELERDADEMLNDALDRAAVYGVKLHKAIEYGDSSREIVNFAREEPGITQIIMGSAGRRGIAKSLLGSTAERVSRRVGTEVACPVTIVPPMDATGEGQ